MIIRFAEEILLLILDEEHGDLPKSYSEHLLDIVVAGAVLMDLALEGRIDTDLRKLVLVDSTPLDDELLDPTLADIASGPDDRNADYWITRTAERGAVIRERAFARLVENGVLEADGDGMFFSSTVSRSRRYPTRGGGQMEEARLRIMRVLFSDEIPDPRDVVLVCLSDASGVLSRLLTPQERRRLRERIEQIRKLDLIGRFLLPAIRERRLAEPAEPPARPSSEIPEVKGLPLLGSALGMRGDLSVFFARQYQELGPVFRVRALNRRLLVMAGSEAVRFLQKNGKAHLRTTNEWQHFSWGMGASRTVIAHEGPSLVRMRKTMAPGLSPQRLQEQFPDFMRITRAEVAGWLHRGPVAARSALQRMIARQTGALLVDFEIVEGSDDMDRFLAAVLVVAVARRRPKWWMKLPRVARARKSYEALFDEIMAAHERRRSSGVASNVVDDLLDLHRRDPRFLAEEDLLGVIGSLPLAALHTAAFTVVFALYEALKRPRLLNAMRAEADALFDGGATAAPPLARLDVTHRFAMEAMRVYSITPAVMRSVTNSFVFAGYTIPAGVDVLIAYGASHHLPEHFPDPERFDIDRYTPERAEHRAPGVYVPFSAGAHSCLGRGFSQIQIALTLATIFHEVDLEMRPPGYKLKVTYGLSPRPADSFRFVARRRKREDAAPTA
ncbi:MAG: cytochrome P450 [Acidobacteria bacterium]|nr:cytochrome P450 [Acidobacteriota bacterium]MDE2850186.1 cytochrome P450 [Acidobacteriota bacterium]